MYVYMCKYVCVWVDVSLFLMCVVCVFVDNCRTFYGELAFEFRWGLG